MLRVFPVYLNATGNILSSVGSFLLVDQGPDGEEPVAHRSSKVP